MHPLTLNGTQDNKEGGYSLDTSLGLEDTKDNDGQYGIVTNYREFFYGEKSCPVPNPEFCFSPHEYTTIGQTAITPIPIYEEDIDVDSEPGICNLGEYTPVFNIHIDRSTLNLERLLGRKDTHMIEKADAPLNELLHDGDSEITTTSTRLEIGIKGLMIGQTILLIILVALILWLRHLMKQEGSKLGKLVDARCMYVCVTIIINSHGHKGATVTKKATIDREVYIYIYIYAVLQTKKKCKEPPAQAEKARSQIQTHKQ